MLAEARSVSRVSWIFGGGPWRILGVAGHDVVNGVCFGDCGQGSTEAWSWIGLLPKCVILPKCVLLLGERQSPARPPCWTVLTRSGRAPRKSGVGLLQLPRELGFRESFLDRDGRTVPASLSPFGRVVG